MRILNTNRAFVVKNNIRNALRCHSKENCNIRTVYRPLRKPQYIRSDREWIEFYTYLCPNQRDGFSIKTSVEKIGRHFANNAVVSGRVRYRNILGI